MKSAVLRVCSILGVLLVCVCVFWGLRAPKGYAAWMERRVETRELEKHNAELAKENQLKRARIQKLLEDRGEIDRTIRERMKKLKPGETQFIIQDNK
jgi:cell division protein FtsB